MKFPFLCFVLLIAATVGSHAQQADVSVPGSGQQWLGKHDYLSALVSRASRGPSLDIYLLGDSITEFWPEVAPGVWHAAFGKLHVLDCGVSGDITQNILYRITHGEFEHISPKIVVVLAGINNLGSTPQLTPEELARGLQRIVTTLRTKSPTSKILLLSIFPSGEPSNPIRDRILDTNKKLAALDDGTSVFYLDIFHAFLGPAGSFLPGLSPDGTHLTAKGYQVWADAMHPALQKLLAPTPP